MRTNVFKLSEEDFFVSPLVVSSDVGNRLIDEGFVGVTIDGPGVVELDRRNQFPIVAVRVDESMEASRWIFKNYALITAMDISSGVLHAEYFIEQRFLKMKRDLENNPPPPGKVANAASADLFERLQLGKWPAEYLVNVILLDHSSNRIRVKVGESGLLKDEAAFRRSIAKNPLHTMPRIKAVDSHDPTGKNLHRHHLDIPGKSGLVGRVNFRQAGKSKDLVPWLQLAYRLPHPVTGKNEWESELAAGKVPVPIELLATGTKVPAPWIRHLEHLGSLKQTADGERFIAGQLELRLSDLEGLESDQVYSLYVFSGESMLGPIQMDWRTGVSHSD